MSGQSTPAARPPKQLSSRLMTMKFMQRAANSQSQSPSSPGTPPSAKRLKTSHSSSPITASLKFPDGPTNPSRTPVFPSAPTDSTGNQLMDDDMRAAMRQAVADEEGRRQAALARTETASAETRWVLSAADAIDDVESNEDQRHAGPMIVRWDERATIDEEDDDEQDDLAEAPWRAGAWEGADTGRMRFGTWKARESAPAQYSKEESDDSRSDSSQSESDDNPRTPTHISAAGVMAREKNKHRAGVKSPRKINVSDRRKQEHRRGALS